MSEASTGSMTCGRRGDRPAAAGLRPLRAARTARTPGFWVGSTGCRSCPANKLPKADDTPKPGRRRRPPSRRPSSGSSRPAARSARSRLRTLYATQAGIPQRRVVGGPRRRPVPAGTGLLEGGSRPVQPRHVRQARPVDLRQPGEATEISTIHADKAVLEFDRPINTPQDMSRAKLMRMELVSEPASSQELEVEPRRGKVHITNNQRSADPNQMPRACAPRARCSTATRSSMPRPTTGPDIWTDAAVEDRGPAEPAAAVRGRAARRPRRRAGRTCATAVVADILAGRRCRPPTVTAVGMRLYLESTKPAKETSRRNRPRSGRGHERAPPARLSRRCSSTSGWIRGRRHGRPARAGTPRNRPGPTRSTHPAAHGRGRRSAACSTGYTARQLEPRLLQIETLGPFAYETATSAARFDVVAQSNPNVPNDVQVTRMMTREEVVKGEPPRERQNKLFSQTLEIEFNGSPTSGGIRNRGRDGADPLSKSYTPGPTRPADSSRCRPTRNNSRRSGRTSFSTK